MSGHVTGAAAIETGARMALVDRYLAAVENGDFARMREIYSVDARVWLNDGRGDRDAEELIAKIARIRGIVRGFRFDTVRRTATEDGGVFVQQVLRGVLPDERDVFLPVALYFSTDGVTISRVDEYLDAEILTDLEVTGHCP